MSLQIAKEICEILNKNGFESYLVGGCVRDMLLNVPINDLDLCTNAKPEQIKDIFNKLNFKLYTIGEKFGTIAILKDGYKIEITTYRSENNFTDKRNYFNVTFENSLKKDLERRDLTVNSMAFNPINNELIDLFNGKEDLNNHIIKFVGIPSERIKEDPLRMLRAIRFSGKLESFIEYESFKAIKENCSLINKVSNERIKEELLKILSIKDCFFALEYLKNTGILNEILPELSRLDKIKQPKKYHKFNVLYHMFQTVLFIPESKPLLRFCGLIHDIGKTECRINPPYFPQHEIKGERIFKVIAKRFKLSVNETQYISFLISYHMTQFNFPNIQNNTSAYKRYLSKMDDNIKYLDDLFILFKADKDATFIRDDRITIITNYTEKKLKEIINNKEALQIKDLNIKGTDLINLGLPINNTISITLNLLLDFVINGDLENNKEALINQVKAFINDKVILIKE